MFEKVKLGLALGAGGARGLAHIGVLKALERGKIRVSFLSGSSMGALIGAAYAISGNAAELEQRVLEFISSDIYEKSGLPSILTIFQNKAESWPQRLEAWLKKAYVQARFVSSPAVLDSNVFREIIDYLIPDVLIEDLSVPFWALGTDLKSGRAVVFKRGSLRSAIYASAAIPGVVNPLELNDLLVVDGGVLHMVPVVPVRHMGADVVLAVDVEKCGDQDERFNSAIELLFRVEDIQNSHLREMHLQLADMVVRPEVGHIHWSNFERATELIRLGQDRTIQHLEAIKALTQRRRMPWRTGLKTPPLPVPDWLVV